MEGDTNWGDMRAFWQVSIHAPAWRATTIGFGSTHDADGFDPRPRMEGDPVNDAHFRRIIVSIRAPAWRATRVPARTPRGRWVFDAEPRSEGRE